jgi:hypothetical protein
MMIMMETIVAVDIRDDDGCRKCCFAGSKKKIAVIEKPRPQISNN